MTEIKVGQVWLDNKNNVINVITNLYSQYGHDYDGVQYEEPFCCGIDNRNFTFNCIKRQFEDEVEYNGHKLIATYPTWQEAINSKEFKGE